MFRVEWKIYPTKNFIGSGRIRDKVSDSFMRWRNGPSLLKLVAPKTNKSILANKIRGSRKRSFRLVVILRIYNEIGLFTMTLLV